MARPAAAQDRHRQDPEVRPGGGRAVIAATISRIEGEFGWEIIYVYGLTETAPFITLCEPRPEHAGLPVEDRATSGASAFSGSPVGP